ncbi:PREDICTED: uncharacterized protein LOC106788956 [Polistes canadensis]|uniref:uncharacterized protein LOC106788956 n=1 Tax=Polistes canadensis TaxID=91411 RepID=UPI0007190406|nr:PREDICTED: uncharacterized protein LOC106788956 [Polistes canadensis]
MDLSVPRTSATNKKSNTLSGNKNSTPISSSSIKSKELKSKNNGRTVELSSRTFGNQLRSNKPKDSTKFREKIYEKKRIATAVEKSSQRGFQVENSRTKKSLIPSIVKTFNRNIKLDESMTIKKKRMAKELDRSDKLGQESSSKSMRQLFSIADSWSSDSLVSHSDSCTCCHKKELCPIHGKNSFANNKR